MRQSWEAITNGWNQWVLNYTPEKQRNFIKSFGFGDVDWRSMAALMLVFGIIAVAIVILPLIWHQQKRDPLAVIYETLCHRMAKRGFPKAIHEGPCAYRVRLTHADSPLSPKTKAALDRFLQLYEILKYGTSNAAPAAPLSNLKSLLTECR
jgi:hypothetical protein